jgi:hypothetical protein
MANTARSEVRNSASAELATDWQVCALEQAVRLAIQLGKLDQESGKALLGQIESCHNIVFCFV